MNCLFCDRELTDPVKQDDSMDSVDGVHLVIFATYKCLDCRAEFVQLESIGQVTEYNFRYLHYYVDVDVANSTTEIKTGSLIMRRGKYVMEYTSVLKLDSIAPLTPRNAKEKLPLYILFS